MQIRHEHANVGVHFDMHGEPLKPIPKTFHGLQFLVAINWQTYKKRAGKSPCLITRWSKPMWLTLPIDLTLQFGGLNQCPSPYGSSSLVNAFLMKTKATATSSWKTLHWLKNASFSSQNQATCFNVKPQHLPNPTKDWQVSKYCPYIIYIYIYTYMEWSMMVYDYMSPYSTI